MSTTEITTVAGVKELGRELSNWGRWGADDEIGTVNFLTPERRAAAARVVRNGQSFDLGMPFDEHGPQPGGDGRFNPIHLMSLVPSPSLAAPDGMIGADDVITMPLQCGTQWDSLAHCGYDGLLYNATPPERVNVRFGAERNSFDRVAGKLIGRGVLLDIAGLRGRALVPGEEVTADALDAAEEQQGVAVGTGDILLVRTGWYRHFLAGDASTFMGDEPGLGLSTLAWLHEREVAAVAVDNWAVEVLPSRVEGSLIPFHMVAIRDIGLMLGEMFQLEELAVACTASGTWDFLFCAPGLKITGAVGSPITPVAVT